MALVTGSITTFDFNKPIFEQNLPFTYPPESRNAADPAALPNLFNSTSRFAYFTRTGAVNRFSVSVDRLPVVYDNGTLVGGQGERLYFPATEKFISFTFGGGLGWTRKLVPSGKAGIPAGTTLRVSLSLVDLSSYALPVGPERRIFETAFQGTSQLPVPNSTILYTTVLNPCRASAYFDPSRVRRAFALVQTAVLDPAPAKPPTWAELDQYGSFDFSYAITMSDPISIPYVNGSILLKNEIRNPGILVPGGGLAAAVASFGARVSPNYPNPILLSFTDFLYVPVLSTLYLYIAIPASIVAPDAYNISDILLSDFRVESFSECRIGGSSDSGVDAKRGVPGETFRLINRAWKPANITYAVFSRSYYASSKKEVQNLLRITLPGDSASFPGDANRDWIFGVYDEFTHPGFQSLPTPSPSPAARTPNAGTVLTPFMSTVMVIVGTAMLCLLQ